LAILLHREEAWEAFTMRILLVAGHRPWKSAEPLKRVKADFQTVILNPRRPDIANLVTETVGILSKSITYRPEIVLCHGAIHNSFTALVLVRLISRPFVVRAAGDIFEDYRTNMAYYRKRRQIVRLMHRWLIHRMGLFVMHHSNGIITVANHLKEKILSQAGGSLPSIEIVPVPCDISRFTDASADCVSDAQLGRKRIILTVTNLNFEEKLEGLKKALPPLANVLEQRQDVVFLVAGDGFFFDEIKNYIEKHHPDLLKKKRIILLGFVQEIEKLYALADIVVYYSFRDGCPNVMLEAWAARKPLVVNDSDWAREHVNKGTALIARDGSELIEQVEMLLDSAEAREELSDKGYEYVSRNYNSEVVGKKLENALRKLTRKPSAKEEVREIC
jgi:glycosyltransferase involved in cell wall biosynthesis